MPLPIMLAHKICEAARRGAQGRRAPVPAARRQGAGDGALRGRRARPPAPGRDRARARLDAAPRRARRRDADQARPHRARAASRSCRTDLYDEQRARRARLRLRQPDRQVRDRRPDGRHRPDRPQDHRRHLRRRGPHGGGAFSGKDPTKVDRSAAYAARYVAKNVVAAGLADRCEVQVAYAIGVAHPVSIAGRLLRHRARSRVARIEELIREHFDLRPAAILRDLDLRRPIYAKTAAYGHFGRDDHDFTWERTDKADALRAAAGRRRRGRVSPSVRRDAPDEQAGGGLLADRASRRRSRRTVSCPAAGCASRPRRSRRARSPGRRTSAGGRRRARRGGRSSARAPGSRSASGDELAVLGLLEAVSTGQPCGQRSGWPSRSSIRSIMSSLKVSPSSSAWTCASAAV